MIKKKLIKNAKKIDKFLTNYLKKQKKSLLVKPMKYGVISGGKKIRSTIILDAGKLFNIDEKKLINVFVPTTPNPTSGFLLMFPIEDVIYLDMTFEEASKFIVSAGTSTKKS